MTCDELRDDLDLYALGVAGEPENQEIREHLRRNCDVCTARLKEARRLAALLGATAAPAAPAPPPRLRKRILASVGAPSSSGYWGLIATVAAALCLVAAFYFSGRERDVSGQLIRVREQSRAQTIELARLQEAFSILNAAGTTVGSFGEGQPKGKVFVNPTRGVLLIANNLPPAPAGKRYEMWLIPKGAKPVRAGLFQSDPDGRAMHIQPGPVDLTAGGAVAVTLENEPGADQPTSAPLIVAPLQ